MKKLKIVSIIIILKIFQFILNEESNQPIINEEEEEKQERLKFENYILNIERIFPK